MSVDVDRRFVDRRRRVREAGARRHLRWGIAIVLVTALAAVVMVAFRSPLLAIRTISISGRVNADIQHVLDRHAVAVGVPTIGVRAAPLEEDLLQDPWVARADVRVTWPGAVDVVVLEHRPAAWMELTTGWALLSADGVVLETGAPPDEAPVVRIAAGAGRPGTTLRHPAALAALAFVGGLSTGLVPGAEVELAGDDLVARVHGHEVILGNPTDMAAKAATLVALFEGGLPPGALVNLIAPGAPAVALPEPARPNPQVEVEGADAASTEASG
jgi:cell division protein FtsQ